MNTVYKNKIIQAIDMIAAFSIGLITVGYVMYAARFAERHIQFPFLDFPVFIGEFLLIFCAMLFAIRVCLSDYKFNKWQIILSLYFIFVLSKAAFGYAKWGALAFRHAALMYYPVFAVFGYAFLRKKNFTDPVKLFVLSVIVGIFVIRDFYFYPTVIMLNIAIILILSFKNSTLKYLSAVVLVLTTPYRYFFHTARMMILGHIIYVLYLFAVGLYLLRWPRRYKLMGICLTLVILAVGVEWYAGFERVHSIFAIDRHVAIFKKYDDRVQSQKDTFEFKEFGPVQIYNPNKTIEERSIQLKSPLQEGQAEGNEAHIRMSEDMFQEETPTTAKIGIERKSKDGNNYESDLNNSVFRLLVWRDMFEEYATAGWPVIGFDYGKPLRSISIEILNWCRSEWSRDGWVAPHNSFLHIMYRSGIVGCLLIFGICIFLVRMAIFFIRRRDFRGILLCGSIIMCFVAANFLIVLEAPYSAIPIWTLYGATVRYYVEEVRNTIVVNGAGEEPLQMHQRRHSLDERCVT
ncbi:MAG: O-antigen ligase family protein [Candidatus Omnitrophica bacterium]|nr:O-antigen ligase family protein [Candidatus Omnitrophota bacterium]